MKKAYVKPSMESEMFVPHAYIAACGDTEYGNYLFECNAGNRRVDYAIKDASGHVAVINGHRFDGNRNWSYSPCGATHEAPTNDEFLTGYHLDNPDTWWDENIAVIIWTDRGRDVHCTTNLDQDSWKTDKS